MGLYTGKQFEKDFEQSCENNPRLSFDRLYDAVGGYAGVKNICDFIVYCYPIQYYFELKSHKGDRLPFSDISDHQWNGLYGKATGGTGAMAGILVHFADHEETYFVDIRDLQSMKYVGEKSIHISTAREKGVKLNGRKKRVTWEYYLEEGFFRRIDGIGRCGDNNAQS